MAESGSEFFASQLLEAYMPIKAERDLSPIKNADAEELFKRLNNPKLKQAYATYKPKNNYFSSKKTMYDGVYQFIGLLLGKLRSGEAIHNDDIAMYNKIRTSLIGYLERGAGICENGGCTIMGGRRRRSQKKLKSHSVKRSVVKHFPRTRSEKLKSHSAKSRSRTSKSRRHKHY